MKNTSIFGLLLGLLITCQTTNELSFDDRELPSLGGMWNIYKTLDTQGLNRELADTLMRFNRDLQSSNLYVLAAWQYCIANLPDMAGSALERAIDNGMANPNILTKYDGLEIISSSSYWPDIERRLDSIESLSRKFENFDVDITALDTFWPYFERALEDTITAQEELASYILYGTPVVREFYTKGYKSTYQMFRHMIRRSPGHYQYIREIFQPAKLDTTKESVSEMMGKFYEIYPAAVFPKVYIVPGIFNTGGTATDLGLIICADNYVKSDDMPLDGLQDWQLKRIDPYDEMKYVILHELMHFQQNYQDHVNRETVLANVIMEGVCDFLVELVTGYIRHSSMLEYLSIGKNMDFIVDEFKKEIYSDTAVDKWMKNPDVEDRPVDIGYALGYLICKSYYEMSENKAEAVRELLTTDDFSKIIRRSTFSHVLN